MSIDDRPLFKDLDELEAEVAQSPTGGRLEADASADEVLRPEVGLPPFQTPDEPEPSKPDGDHDR